MKWMIHSNLWIIATVYCYSVSVTKKKKNLEEEEELWQKKYWGSCRFCTVGLFERWL